MTLFERIVFFVLGVLFAIILLHNITNLSIFKKWTSCNEPFVTPGDQELGGGEDDEEEDDEFFQKMNAEFMPTSVDDIDKIVNELDKEEEVPPEEMDFIDADDIELPEKEKKEEDAVIEEEAI